MLFIAGPAGSGKSLLTSTLSTWIERFEYSVCKVNLDPASELLPYVPDVDAKRYVNARDLMIKRGLGPNGALLASMDELLNYVVDIKTEIEDCRADYVLVDLPGQLEVIAFRLPGPRLLQELAEGSKAAVIFLIDARLVSKMYSAYALLLLALSTTYRLNLPMVLAVNKVDLVVDLTTYSNKKLYEKLYEALPIYRLLSEYGECPSVITGESFLDVSVSVQLCEIFRQFIKPPTPISAREAIGLDDLITEIENVVATYKEG
ncbi:MAG: ATP/GTP-binding protein [Sulfolobales archaeon]|nr:ATP/GTP-binding protein [Sulfolobales archaeon]MDW8083500.1 ATP/GTP-binding protein [Sulfolobales archaeon]